MHTIEKDTYLLITINENNNNLFSKDLADKLNPFSDKHIVLQIENDITISNEDVSVLVNLGTEKKENGTSFVVVYRNVSIDNVPESLNIVPTIKEAEDVLEMENIERELGL